MGKMKLYTGPALNALTIDTDRATLVMFPGYMLYPRQRIELAENYAKRMNEGENLVILTQDDIIIRGIMLMVARRGISCDDVDIIYVGWKNNEPFEKKCALCEDGRFEKRFPEDMFDMSYKILCEIMSLNEARIKREEE